MVVKVEVEEIRKWLIMRFQCPVCGVDDSFTHCTASPFYCWNCGNRCPFLSDMLYHVNDRLFYYLHGR